MLYAKFVREKLLFFLVLAFLGAYLASSLGINPFQKKDVCANSISCIKDLTGLPQDVNQGIFMGRRVTVPKEIVKAIDERQVLGQVSNPNKHIFVDLSKQELSAYEGDKLAFSFPVSTGKWRYTPTGDFRIWIKLRYVRMTGGNPSDGTFYDLPNVPYTMFFYNSQYPQSMGFGLHGAYWHNNFGHPMSHGCINISIPNAEKLFNWADPPSQGYTTYSSQDSPGTLLTIYGITPNE